ncbi:MAG: CbbX protein, partial [Betaproteobacteria bacterium]|nr:CbbX protein [Betaproteobacteria bacterium]
MSSPLHAIPGSTLAPSAAGAGAGLPAMSGTDPAAGARSVAEVLAGSQVEAVLQELDTDLVGLKPVKARIRDIAALLVIDKLRLNLGLASQSPSLHMCFSGNPGTG